MKLLLTLIFSFCIFHSSAQLEGKKFKTILNAPYPTPVILSFTRDTLYFLAAEDLRGMPKNTILETASYIYVNGVLSITKVSGGSPCDDKVVGVYRFEMKDGKWYITLMDDRCYERAKAWDTEPMVAVINLNP